MNKFWGAMAQAISRINFQKLTLNNLNYLRKMSLINKN